MRSRSFLLKSIALLAGCAALAAAALPPLTEATAQAHPAEAPSGKTPAASLTFVWPVDDPLAMQPYAGRGWHGSAWPSYNAGIDCHTAVDVRPSWAGNLEFDAPVRAAADGRVERLVPYGGKTLGMGNTVILSHANGVYTLYGHLDRFAPGLAVGAQVSQGDLLGYMGNSGYQHRLGTDTTHVHFEIKRYPVIFDAPGPPKYVGYTPGHPDFYGYADPRDYAEGIVKETISPRALIVTDAGPIEIRGSPGKTFLDATETAVDDHLSFGQMAVATRKAFVEGHDWYFVDLPSTNTPPAETKFPTRGPTGGWIDGDLVDDAASLTMIQVRSKFAVVRACPERTCAVIASVSKGQLFASSEEAPPGPGCRLPFYRISLPGSAATSDGWVCGAAAQVLP